MLRVELQKSFERMDKMAEPNPNNITELEVPLRSVRR